jgi:hypothetical protein
MDEQRNDFIAVAATPNGNLKPYKTPALRRLGDIQSDVLGTSFGGNDNEGGTANS